MGGDTVGASLGRVLAPFNPLKSRVAAFGPNPLFAAVQDDAGNGGISGRSADAA
jgi:hypothetical protein